MTALGREERRFESGDNCKEGRNKAEKKVSTEPLRQQGEDKVSPEQFGIAVLL